MLRVPFPGAVLTVRLPAALAAISVPVMLWSRMRWILELPQRVAEGLDFLLVGASLDLHVIEHFRHLFHVTQHVVELVDDGQHVF